MKALGTGVRGVSWRDIEVQRRRGQAPEIVLHGRAKARAEKMGIVRVAISLSHSRDFAIASVVAETTSGGAAGIAKTSAPGIDGKAITE